MDVPELTGDLIGAIADQSDAQSGALSIRDLERLRDDNLVGILRSLKARRAAAGAVIAEHEKALRQDGDGLVTVARQVPVTWTDYNGHMNETHYLELFSQATDRLMEVVGADAAYVAGGFSYFTAETHLRHLGEVHAGDRVEVRTRVLPAPEKKLHLFHELHAPAGLVATGEHLLLHVDLGTRKTCAPPEAMARAIGDLVADAPRPEGAGRAIVAR